MPRLPLLDPRSYGLDDLLRRPFFSHIPVGSGGGKLHMGEAPGWGFPGVATFETTTISAPISISVWVEGTPLFPADILYRPSYITGNSQEPEYGLQVIEDKFITADDVLVTVLSLRNPGDFAVSVEIRVKWGIGRGEHTDAEGNTFYVSRYAPNSESRRLTVAGGARARMTFALAIAHDDRYAREPGETAQRRAAKWAGDTSAVITQGEELQRWADRNVPRFDCPDPWCLRAWYHAFHLQRKYPQRTFDSVQDTYSLADFLAIALQQFEKDHYDTPSETSTIFLPTLFVEGVLRMRQQGEMLSFHPASDLAAWQPFCVVDWHWNGQLLSIVWDSPESPTDAYDDGDKGFTVYLGDTVIHHQNDLSPCEISLTREVVFDDDDDE